MSYVTLRELAEWLGIDRSGVRRYARRKGFEFEKVRTKESRNQLTLALTKAEAKRLLKVRKDDGF